MIDAYASESQYLNKLIPIWDALPPDMKGQFVVHPRLDGSHGLSTGKLDRDGILMVASSKDSKRAAGKIIYVEHGAGQTYGERQWYSGHTRDNMIAAIVPGPYCAAKTQIANPGIPVIPIGAPHLANIERSKEQGIMFSWHWRCSVEPESDTAYDEYQHLIHPIADRWAAAGTGHPRIVNEIAPYYHQNKMTVFENPRAALAYAGLVIADNTSLIYEAACLDIPVILLNKSTYRKDAHWGLRFWDQLPGPQCDHPDDLVRIIEEMIDGGYAAWADERRRVSNLIYGKNPFSRLPHAVKSLCEVVKAHADSN